MVTPAWALAVIRPSRSNPPLPMRHLSIQAASALLLLLCTSCQSNTPEGSVPMAEFRDGQQIGLPVFGLSCPKCANNVTHKLSELEGVTSVDVDMSQGFVTVHAEEGKVPTREAFVEAVHAAGFTVPDQAPTATTGE